MKKYPDLCVFFTDSMEEILQSDVISDGELIGTLEHRYVHENELIFFVDKWRRLRDFLYSNPEQNELFIKFIEEEDAYNKQKTPR